MQICGHERLLLIQPPIAGHVTDDDAPHGPAHHDGRPRGPPHLLPAARLLLARQDVVLLLLSDPGVLLGPVKDQHEPGQCD